MLELARGFLSISSSKKLIRKTPPLLVLACFPHVGESHVAISYAFIYKKMLAMSQMKLFQRAG